MNLDTPLPRQLGSLGVKWEEFPFLEMGGGGCGVCPPWPTDPPFCFANPSMMTLQSGSGENPDRWGGARVVLSVCFRAEGHPHPTGVILIGPFRKKIFKNYFQNVDLQNGQSMNRNGGWFLEIGLDNTMQGPKTCAINALFGAKNKPLCNVHQRFAKNVDPCYWENCQWNPPLKFTGGVKIMNCDYIIYNGNLSEKLVGREKIYSETSEGQNHREMRGMRCCSLAKSSDWNWPIFQ